MFQCKLWNSNHRPAHVREDLEASLRDLGLDYVDSFVIHWPQAVPSKGLKAAVRTDGCYIDHYSKGRVGFCSAQPGSHWFCLQVP